MTHAFLAPSSAGVWAYCAGAPLLSTMYPDEETMESREGDAVHWVIAQMLISYKSDSGILTPSQIINTRAPNGVVITSDMTERAMVMVNDVLSYCQDHGLLQSIHVEEHMEIPEIHRNNAGTPDFWVVDDVRKHILLTDYKDGHLNIPARSWQNINYMSGIKTRLGIDGYAEQEWTVTLRIIQPRSYSSEGPIKSATMTMSDLRGDWNILKAQAEQAHQPDPGVRSGPHCRYCPARHGCTASRTSAAIAAEYATSALPEVLSDEALSFELAILRPALDLLKYRLGAIEEEAKKRIQSGQHYIPGYTVEQGNGKRKFTLPDDQMFVLGDLIGIDLRDKQKAITPAEFERRLKSANRQRKNDGLDPIDDTVISSYITTPKGGFSLVEVDSSKVVKAFTQG